MTLEELHVAADQASRDVERTFDEYGPGSPENAAAVVAYEEALEAIRKARTDALAESL